MPILLSIFKMPPKLAVGTSFLMMSITTTAGGITHLSLGFTKNYLALAILIGAAGGAVIGNLFLRKSNNYLIGKIIGYSIGGSGLFILIGTVFF